MDREAWCAVVDGVSESWTRLSDWAEDIIILESVEYSIYISLFYNILLFLELVVSLTFYFCLIIHLPFIHWNLNHLPSYKTPQWAHWGDLLFPFPTCPPRVLHSLNWIAHLWASCSAHKEVAFHPLLGEPSFLYLGAQDFFILGLHSSCRTNLWEYVCKKWLLYLPLTVNE